MSQAILFAMHVDYRFPIYTRWTNWRPAWPEARSYCKSWRRSTRWSYSGCETRCYSVSLSNAKERSRLIFPTPCMNQQLF